MQTDRALQTTRHMDQIRGGGVGDIALQARNESSLCFYFVHILSLTDWTCSACQAGVRSYGSDDMEFAGRSSVQ